MGDPPVISCTIPGNPGDGGINAAYRAVRRKQKGAEVVVMTKTPRGKKFEARGRRAIKQAMADQPDASSKIRAAGKVEARFEFYWPTQRHLDGAEDLAHGDVDAPEKATLDVLADAKDKKTSRVTFVSLIDDDARVVELTLAKAIDRENPRIEITVWPA